MYQNQKFSSSESSNIQDSSQKSGIERFINKMHSLRVLQLLGAVSQIILGLCITVASFLGFIQSLWLSGFLIALGSVATIIGSYLVYIIRVKSSNYNSLKRNAIKRVMKAKN